MPEPGTGVAALEPFDAFATAVGQRLSRPVDGWAPTDLLVDRLAWDSLRVLEVLGWLRELGIELPEELVGELRTLGDLHHYVVTIGGRVGEATPPPRRPLVGPRVRLVPLTARHEGEALALYTSMTAGLLSQQMANEPGVGYDSGIFSSLTDTAFDLFFAHYTSNGGPHADTRP